MCKKPTTNSTNNGNNNTNTGNNSTVLIHGLGSREVTTSTPPQPK